MTLYFIGVSKEYNNSKNRRANPTRSGKRKMAHYISESWHKSKKKEGFVSYYFKKYFKIKWKRRTFYCEECLHPFKALVSIFSKEVDCPYCDEE